MAQKIIVLVCLQAIIFQASAQVINSQMLSRLLAPPCGCANNLQQLTLEQLVLPGGPALQSGPLGYFGGPQTVVYDQPPTTIIQDSTVANNLANALQLLVVSNLLSSALPLDSPAPLVAPAPLPLYAPLDLSAAPLLAQRPLCNCGCNAPGLNPYNNIVFY